MKRNVFFCVALLFSCVAVQRPAFGSGVMPGFSTPFTTDNPEGMLPPECWVVSVSLKNIGNDLPTPAATYVSSGKCNIKYSSNNKGVESTFDKLKITSTIDWTGEGTYQPLQKNAWEEISIRQINVDRPGYSSQGTLKGWGTCAKDPWREPDGLACGSPGYSTAGTIDPAVAGYYGKALRVPLTSYLTAPQRAGLNSAYQAAVRKAQEIHVVAAPSTGKSSAPAFALAATVPSVVSPTSNQVFSERTSIPIKLTSPTSLNAAGYVVNIETKNSGGAWIAHATIPVGVAQAQSAAGYTGFGAGAPPAFLALPGTWRMNAQVSSPKQSGPSPWVEFTVRSNTRAKK